MPNSPFIYGPNNQAINLQSGIVLPGTTSGTVSITPAATTTSYPLVLPAAQAAPTTFLQNDGSGNLSWQPAGGGGGGASYNIVFKTAAYTALIGDGILANGAFAVTLPTAVGNANATIFIKNIGTSLSSIINFNTVSGQTVEGMASGLAALWIQNESIQLISDGSNWRILDHYIPSVWAPYTAVYTGVGTVTSSDAKWRRVGDSIELIGYFVSGTVAATIFSISLPTPLTIDTTKVTRGNTTAATGQIFGVFGSQSNGGEGASILTAPGTSTALLYVGSNYGASGSGGLLAQNGNSVTLSVDQVAFRTYLIPILQWNFV